MVSTQGSEYLASITDESCCCPSPHPFKHFGLLRIQRVRTFFSKDNKDLKIDLKIL